MIKFKVTGMTCEHCERAVSNALSGVPGVERVVSVSRDKKEAVVEGKADPAALIATIREEGYEAEVAG